MRLGHRPHVGDGGGGGIKLFEGFGERLDGGVKFELLDLFVAGLGQRERLVQGGLGGGFRFFVSAVGLASPSPSLAASVLPATMVTASEPPSSLVSTVVTWVHSSGLAWRDTGWYGSNNTLGPSARAGAAIREEPAINNASGKERV